jgi:hypothetical protein
MQESDLMQNIKPLQIGSTAKDYGADNRRWQ